VSVEIFYKNFDLKNSSAKFVYKSHFTNIVTRLYEKRTTSENDPATDQQGDQELESRWRLAQSFRTLAA